MSHKLNQWCYQICVCLPFVVYWYIVGAWCYTFVSFMYFFNSPVGGGWCLICDRTQVNPTQPKLPVQATRSCIVYSSVVYFSQTFRIGYVVFRVLWCIVYILHVIVTWHYIQLYWCFISHCIFVHLCVCHILIKARTWLNFSKCRRLGALHVLSATFIILSCFLHWALLYRTWGK